MVTTDLQDSVKNAMRARVQARMRRTVKDSMMTTMKSLVWMTMRRTMGDATINVVCRYR